MHHGRARMSTTAYPPSGEHGSDAAIVVRRFVNDEIAAAARKFDGGDRTVFEFMCECGDLDCRALIALTLAEYDVSAPGAVVAH